MDYNIEEVTDMNAEACDTAKGITKGRIYSRTATVEKHLSATALDVNIRSENCIEVRHRCKSGHEIRLDARVYERSLDLTVPIPLQFRAGSKDVTDLLNEMNDWARENGHPEYWTMGYRGKVYLYSKVIDDDRIDEMDDTLRYLVSDMLEFAEYGINKLSNELSDMYVPAAEETGDMYR